MQGRKAVLALGAAVFATVFLPVAAAAANTVPKVWVPASTAASQRHIPCPDKPSETCTEKSGIAVKGHYAPAGAPRAFLERISGAVRADWCAAGFPATGAANWVNYLELDNLVGIPLVHAETDGQTAWNYSTACTVATRDASYSQLSWVIRFKQGPGSFWDYTRNANTTWENVCAGGVWWAGVWHAYLRQYTTSNGHLFGGNFSTTNGC